MMDYMCLPQKPFATPGLKDQFRKSLSHINEWYFHAKTIVLLVTSAPPEGAEYSNTRLHQDRGWCAEQGDSNPHSLRVPGCRCLTAGWTQRLPLTEL